MEKDVVEEDGGAAGRPILGNLADGERISTGTNKSRSPVGREYVEPELASVKQVAAMLSVSYRTIYRLVAAGELPAPVKVGSASRFPVSEIHDYVERLKRDRRDCRFGGNGA